MTIRPIFSPSVRVKVDWPSRRGCGALAGRIKSGLASGVAVLKDVDFPLFAFGSVSRGLGVALGPALGLSKVPALTLFEFAPGHCSEVGTGSLLAGFAASVCVGLFAAASGGRNSSAPVFSTRLALDVRTGSAPKELP